jgi:hypothetical protein
MDDFSIVGGKALGSYRSVLGRDWCVDGWIEAVAAADEEGIRFPHEGYVARWGFWAYDPLIGIVWVMDEVFTDTGIPRNGVAVVIDESL